MSLDDPIDDPIDDEQHKDKENHISHALGEISLTAILFMQLVGSTSTC